VLGINLHLQGQFQQQWGQWRKQQRGQRHEQLLDELYSRVLKLQFLPSSKQQLLTPQ
jgi:hypothetical protein